MYRAERAKQRAERLIEEAKAKMTATTTSRLCRFASRNQPHQRIETRWVKKRPKDLKSLCRV